ncbi:hypothetical protein PsYK624_123110 [Phanerochaete sordida]|uniref:Uncharacterized protein n=1 Tax=Phanerochaete sordida TaxID=48140 RepID=A0A9P3LIF9_9APHY|nr:hypothetical protein PsYK624_123110 [Phanerochaete sordida]
MRPLLSRSIAEQGLESTARRPGPLTCQFLASFAPLNWPRRSFTVADTLEAELQPMALSQGYVCAASFWQQNIARMMCGARESKPKPSPEALPQRGAAMRASPKRAFVAGGGRASFISVTGPEAGIPSCAT